MKIFTNYTKKNYIVFIRFLIISKQSFKISSAIINVQLHFLGLSLVWLGVLQGYVLALIYKTNLEMEG